VTPEEFTAAYGREPQQDDMHRVNCSRAGNLGHSQCGMCEKHHMPRFMCGCLFINQRMVAIGPPVALVPPDELDAIEDGSVPLSQELVRKLISAARALAKLYE